MLAIVHFLLILAYLRRTFQTCSKNYSLRTKYSQLLATIASHASLTKELDAAECRVEVLEDQIGEMEARHGDMQRRVERLEGEVDMGKKRLVAKTYDLAVAEERRDEERCEVSQYCIGTRVKLSTANAQAKSLQSQLAALKKVVRRLDKSKGRVGVLEEQVQVGLEEWGRLEELEGRNGELKGRVEELESQADEPGKYVGEEGGEGEEGECEDENENEFSKGENEGEDDFIEGDDDDDDDDEEEIEHEDEDANEGDDESSENESDSESASHPEHTAQTNPFVLPLHSSSALQYLNQRPAEQAEDTDESASEDSESPNELDEIKRRAKGSFKAWKRKFERDDYSRGVGTGVGSDYTCGE
jgi:cell division protein FtsB